MSFALRPKLRTGLEVGPSFSLSLNEKDRVLLADLQAFFGCGWIRESRSDRTFKYEVRSIGGLLEHVLPHFEGFPLTGNKARSFNGFSRVCRMIKQTGCDAVKLEVAENHGDIVRALADAGVAVIAHLGLKPQSVGLLGGYKFQGRTFAEAREIVASSLQMEDAGAAAILLEAVPPENTKAVVDQTSVPIIGCGAGPACHACVIVTQDGLGLTAQRPRFVPTLTELAAPLKDAFAAYVQSVARDRKSVV